MPAESTTTKAASRRTPLARLPWEEINHPGAYVSESSGKLYRIPVEGLVRGASPAIQVQGDHGPFVRVSEDPSVQNLKAAMLCNEENIQPTFLD
jgi:hypothetical protein